MTTRLPPRPTALALATLLCLASAGDARAQDVPPPGPPLSGAVRLEGRTLVVDTAEGPRPVSLPCEGRALHLAADRAYVACGPGGLVVVRLAPAGGVVEELLAVTGEAVGFFVVGDRVWVETTQTIALPVDQLGRRSATGAALAAPTPATPQAAEAPALPALPAPPRSLLATAEPAAERRVGRVVHVEGGAVIVDLGAADGLSVGSRVALEPPATGTELDEQVGEGPLAVGEVVATTEHRARVRLGLGESVPEGATARRVDADLTRRRAAPPRIPGWSVGFMVRPLLSVGVEGLAVEADTWVQYRAVRNFFARAELAPTGFGIGEGPETGVFAGRLLAGYDHRIFAIGLGVGLVHLRLGGFDFGDVVEVTDAGVRPTIEQHVRVGALDGLYVAATNAFGHAERSDGSEWFAVTATLQIPAGQKTWLLLQGGGGYTRFQWGEIALRHMVRGNGGPGSLFVLGSAGGGAVQWQSDFVTNSYAGPHVGAGLEWRP